MIARNETGEPHGEHADRDGGTGSEGSKEDFEDEESSRNPLIDASTESKIGWVMCSPCGASFLRASGLHGNSAEHLHDYLLVDLPKNLLED